MRKLTVYELEVFEGIKEELNTFEKVLANIFKRYTFKVFQIGARKNYFK